MWTNEQNELSSQTETNPWMESRLTAIGVGAGGGAGGIEKKKKKLMDADGSVGIAGYRGLKEGVGA